MVAIIAGAAKKAISGVASSYLRRGIESMVRRAGTYARRKYYGKRGGGKRRSRGTSRTKISAPFTTQRDYARGTGKRRRGSGFNRFRLRVRAALQSDMPQRTYQALLKGADTVTDGTQGYKGVYLMDLNTTAQGDLWNVFKDAYTLAAVADAENKSIFLKSMSLDLQFYNAGSYQVYITCYTVVARRDNDINQSIGDQFATFFGDESAIGTVIPSHPSMTLYDVPNFLRYWKILRSYKLLIKAGESAQVSIRKSMNRKINGRILQDNDACAKGLTHGFFFQMRGVPINAATPDSGLSGYTVQYSAQTTIHYRQTPGDSSSDTIGQSK